MKSRFTLLFALFTLFASAQVSKDDIHLQDRLVQCIEAIGNVDVNLLRSHMYPAASESFTDARIANEMKTINQLMPSIKTNDALEHYVEFSTFEDIESDYGTLDGAMYIFKYNGWALCLIVEYQTEQLIAFNVSSLSRLGLEEE